MKKMKSKILIWTSRALFNSNKSEQNEHDNDDNDDDDSDKQNTENDNENDIEQDRAVISNKNEKTETAKQMTTNLFFFLFERHLCSF